MIKVRHGMIALSLLFIAGCSSSSDSGSNNGSGGQGTVLIPDLSGPLPTEQYPSNEQLAASNGKPDVASAEALIQGSWLDINPATQCVTTFQFDGDGVFSQTSLDQVASGTYFVDDLDGVLELNLSYTSENFLSDCFGDIADSDALDLSVSFVTRITFPDQDTLEFLRYSFTRQ